VPWSRPPIPVATSRLGSPGLGEIDHWAAEATAQDEANYQSLKSRRPGYRRGKGAPAAKTAHGPGRRAQRVPPFTQLMSDCLERLTRPELGAG